MFFLLQHLQNIEYRILESLAWKEVMILNGMGRRWGGLPSGTLGDSGAATGVVAMVGCRRGGVGCVQWVDGSLACPLVLLVIHEQVLGLLHW